MAKVPLGKTLELTEEEIEFFAEVTEEDIIQTQNAWRLTVSMWAKNLLLATEESGD